MLVDDHALFAKSLAIALEEYSEIEHFIITQETEGLSDLVLREHIDIVLMDINLGKLSGNDGLTLARRLLLIESHSGFKNYHPYRLRPARLPARSKKIRHIRISQ